MSIFLGLLETRRKSAKLFILKNYNHKSYLTNQQAALTFCKFLQWEAVYSILHFRKRKQLEGINSGNKQNFRCIYSSSPMIIQVYSVFNHHKNFLHKNAQQILFGPDLRWGQSCLKCRGCETLAQNMHVKKFCLLLHRSRK